MTRPCAVNMVSKGEGDCCTKEPKCGSTMIWSCACFASLAIGLACIAAAIIVGPCSCDNICGTFGGGVCTGGGCTKSPYDKQKCAAAVASSLPTTFRPTTKYKRTGPHCKNASCQFGGMSWGAWFTVVAFGIIFMILSCVFICGICACGCFAGDDQPAMRRPPQAKRCKVAPAPSEK
jgi:hypothetical protein